MKKADIEIYYCRDFRGGRPSIGVKNFHYGRGLTAEKLECSEEVFEKALEYAFESAQEQFWEDAQDTATHYLDGVKKGYYGPAVVHAAGRSGGHLIIDGLPPVEEWDAILVSAWGRFESAILADIKYRSSAEVVEEDIRANRWNEDGAEKYNFLDKKDGTTVCLSEMKKQAAEAGFAPVIR